MTKFEELNRLKELEEKAKANLLGSRIFFREHMAHAAPWLLHVAEAFQPGDAEKLKYVPCFRLDGDCDKCSDRMRGACDCVRRLQAACEEMER